MDGGRKAGEETSLQYTIKVPQRRRHARLLHVLFSFLSVRVPIACMHLCACECIRVWECEDSTAAVLFASFTALHGVLSRPYVFAALLSLSLLFISSGCCIAGREAPPRWGLSVVYAVELLVLLAIDPPCVYLLVAPLLFSFSFLLLCLVVCLFTPCPEFFGLL